LDNFVTKLSAFYDSFTPSHAKIADHLMNSLDSCAFDTLEEISEKIGVSTTTVIRFSRALGYAGYSEMQKDIQSNIQNKVALPERLRNTLYTSDNQMLQDSFSNDIQNIQKTLEAQNDENLNKVVEKVTAARQVYVLGMRSSFAVAFYMASRLGEIKKGVRLIDSIGMLYPEEIVDATENDVCIAFMFPRYSKMTATAISWLKNQGVEIILFTSMNPLPVAGYGDIILPCAISSISYKNSYAAPMCLTNYLIAAIAKNNYDESKEVLAKTETILKQGYYLGL